MTGGRSDFYLETAVMLTFVVIAVWLGDKFPEPFGLAWLLVYATAWWFACGEYFGKWEFPRLDRAVDRIEGAVR